MSTSTQAEQRRVFWETLTLMHQYSFCIGMKSKINRSLSASMVMSSQVSKISTGVGLEWDDITCRIYNMYVPCI